MYALKNIGVDVPGEGESKLFSFMRRAAASPDFDPSESHAMSGQDADMLIWSLASMLPSIYLSKNVFLQINL